MEQDEVVRSWFLANYEPLGPGPWFGFNTPGAGFGQGAYAPETWPAAVIIDDEFGELLPADLRNEIAAEFHAQTTAWCLITDQVPPATTLNVTQATTTDLPSFVAELSTRLQSLERIQQADEDARHGIGGNQGPFLTNLTTPTEDAKLTLAEGGKAGAAKAELALSAFKEALPSLAKGAAYEVGRHVVQSGWPYVKPLALWMFNEVCQIIPLLERWIELVQAIK